ncbi:hypothetical protein Daus18300_002065 [Diaporthe australafricana]|uniref:Methyltransferase domain-containing protein n=1 Tax=Diaporthe australafricana TaxID=127596 RepID=A0ABR3XRF7_9PEZI
MSEAKPAPSSEGKQSDAAAPHFGSKDRSVTWYENTFSGVPADCRELLENYSQIPPDEVNHHVISMRDKAWDVFPYPCIGQFKFLRLSLYELPSYASMVRRLKQGARYLDIGCCLGQDLRKLVHDGAPAENLYGAELNAPFIDLSYEFFRDKGLAVNFVEADALVLSADSPLSKLKGTIDFVHLAMVLHCFGREDQRVVLENCVSILRPERGSLILGTAVGDLEGSQAPAGHYMHSAETFKELWAEISERTGVEFDCRAHLDDGLGIAEAKRNFGFNKARRLVFEVKRL